MSRQSSWLHQWGFSSGDDNPVAAYIHIPFCRHRCGYCNFSLLANRADLFERFLNSLEREVSEIEEPRPVQTLFLGGGTPSLLPLPLLERLLLFLKTWLPLSGPSMATEWSIEANPLDITDSFCRLCVQHGIDRISIGGQSFHPDKLRVLERDHTPELLISAIETAQEYFKSVSLDLIFAAPGELVSDWKLDVQRAIELDVDHISTYGLTFEKGAKFWSQKEKGLLRPATEETELQMYSDAITRLTSSGYEHYEVSNFAKPANECRHNQVYWEGAHWWAFGPGAARFLGSTRSVNHRGTLGYMKRIESGSCPIEEAERLDENQLLRERFVFGMRQRKGVDFDRLSSSGNASTIQSIAESVERHIELGWMERVGSRIRLTLPGLMVSDGLWEDYL